MYQAFVQSKLQYLVAIWGAASKTVLRPLQTTQNRCLKIVYGKPRLYETLELYSNAPNSIIPIAALRELQTVVTMQNLLHNSRIHHNYVLRRADHTHETRNRANLLVFRQNTETGKKTFTYYGNARYNALPEALKLERNIPKFKKAAQLYIRGKLRQYLI